MDLSIYLTCRWNFNHLIKPLTLKQIIYYLSKTEEQANSSRNTESIVDDRFQFLLAWWAGWTATSLQSLKMTMKL